MYVPYAISLIVIAMNHDNGNAAAYELGHLFVDSIERSNWDRLTDMEQVPTKEDSISTYCNCVLINLSDAVDGVRQSAVQARWQDRRVLFEWVAM
jgi:hypothetical protein